jgi:hypothetical protein
VRRAADGVAAVQDVALHGELRLSLLPYEFGTDAVQQYHSQYPKSVALPQALVAHPGGGGYRRGN